MFSSQESEVAHFACVSATWPETWIRMNAGSRPGAEDVVEDGF